MRRWTRFDIRQAGRHILWVFAGIAALNAAFYIFWVHPTSREFHGLQDIHNPVFEELNDFQEHVERNEAYLEAVKQAEKDLGKLQEEVLSTRDARLVEVHAEVARLCDEFGINLDSVGFSNEILLDEELDRLAMDVPLEGNYTSLRKFLQAVEQSDKFLLVERVALVKGKQGGALLSLNIKLATYFNAPDEMVEKKRARDRRGRRRRS